MSYVGEIISLGVAFSWTITALVSEVGTKRIGVLNFNTWRLGVAMVASLFLVFLLTETVGIMYAGIKTWALMLVSGFVGFYFGDFCLFKSYIYISSRYGQMFMTLAPAVSALAAWLLLKQTLTMGNIIAMAVTIFGIAIAVLGKAEGTKKIKINLPWKGILYGLGAGVGQGFGLVISKVGMDQYERDIPLSMQSEMQNIIPFSANAIRCIAGFACFLITVLATNRGKQTLSKVYDRKTMSMVVLAVVFGPFLGVGFSLMAVQLAKVGVAQTLMSLTPILIIIPSYWLFRQPVTVKSVVGACVSVLGASLFFLI